jgi:hypothetical protein
VTAEADRLKDRIHAIERERERLESYLMRCMETGGLSKVKGRIAGARIQLNNPKVVVDLANPNVADEESLKGNVPAELLRVIPEEVTPAVTVVDKDAVKERWKRAEAWRKANPDAPLPEELTIPAGITVVRDKRLVLL